MVVWPQNYDAALEAADAEQLNRFHFLVSADIEAAVEQACHAAVRTKRINLKKSERKVVHLACGPLRGTTPGPPSPEPLSARTDGAPPSAAGVGNGPAGEGRDVGSGPPVDRPRAGTARVRAAHPGTTWQPRLSMRHGSDAGAISTGSPSVGGDVADAGRWLPHLPIPAAGPSGTLGPDGVRPSLDEPPAHRGPPPSAGLGLLRSADRKQQRALCTTHQRSRYIVHLVDLGNGQLRCKEAHDCGRLRPERRFRSGHPRDRTGGHAPMVEGGSPSGGAP